MSLKGNKGEWSEIYALLKVLADQKLFGGDSTLNRIEKLVYPILEVIRLESGEKQSFKYDNKEVVITLNNSTYRLNISELAHQSKNLLLEIQNSQGSTFAVRQTEDFIRKFGSTSIKADSRAKEDLKIIIHDAILGTTSELGFSIKSQLGGASTLLNAGRTTNFVFKIENLKTDAMVVSEINSIDSRSKIQDRLKAIDVAGGKLRFISTEQRTFGNNLTLIDSLLPCLMASLVQSYYTSSESKVKDLIESMALSNPLDFDASENHPYYSYKVKRMLTDMALGMMPSLKWDGHLHATGGYLIVKDDGEVLCYHVYNRNDFENYLFENTKLDTASSSRHDFGIIYENNGELFIKLNLQIRFVK